MACTFLFALRFHHTLLSVQRQFLTAVTRFFKGASYIVTVVAAIGMVLAVMVVVVAVEVVMGVVLR